MARIVLIHRHGSVIPSVPEAVQKGDTFQWVIHGQLQPLSIALGHAVKATDGSWMIESCALADASAQ
jgi:hypothetical protein